MTLTCFKFRSHNRPEPYKHRLEALPLHLALISDRGLHLEALAL